MFSASVPAPLLIFTAMGSFVRTASDETRTDHAL
jgi:hypothetical protein